MAYGQYHRVTVLYFGKVREIHAVKCLCFCAVRLGIADNGIDAVFPKFIDYINDLGIPGIGAVFLKGKAKYRHPGIPYGNLRPDKVFNQTLRHVFPHIVIDTPSGEYDPAVISQFLCLVSEIIGIYADTVTSHQSRPEIEEIPLCSRCLQHG